MVTTEKSKKQRSFESQMLNRALEGDISCIDNVLEYLGSSIPRLCQIMQRAIHDTEDPRAWRSLLSFLALRKWGAHRWSAYNADHTIISRNIDQSIIEVFTQDEEITETVIKNTILHESLDDLEPMMRYAAAYILGLRGEQCAIPMLEEIIEKGSKNWKVRAAQSACHGSRRTSSRSTQSLAGTWAVSRTSFVRGA